MSNTTVTRARHSRALRALTATGMALTLLTACTPGTAPSARKTPKPTTTAVATPQTDDGAKGFDPVGQAANGGDFEPLTIPEGMDHGDDVDVDISLIGRTDGVPSDHVNDMGHSFTVAVPDKSNGGGGALMLVSIDKVTKPISGAEYESVLNAAAMPVNMDIVVQKLTYRVREVGTIRTKTGSHTTELFDIQNAFTVEDILKNQFIFWHMPDSSFGCVSTPYPFKEHGWGTNDTLQQCTYMIASPAGDVTEWAYGALLNTGQGPKMIRFDVQQPIPEGE